MGKILGIIKDLVKCAVISIPFSAAFAIISGVISFIVYRGNVEAVLDVIKRTLYYTGMLGLGLSVGFFIQRDATRPLLYNDEWKKRFSVLNLGFVIMLVSLFICIAGMVVQNYIEMGRIL
jgi:hypothetical protein